MKAVSFNQWAICVLLFLEEKHVLMSHGIFLKPYYINKILLMVVVTNVWNHILKTGALLNYYGSNNSELQEYRKIVVLYVGLGGRVEEWHEDGLCVANVM